jgi:hypothetical protein
VTSEKLAYWYFRLNGFMTMESFILHNDSRKGLSQRTDADLYGVRFPYRQELGMLDETRFSSVIGKPLFVIAEIKAGECKLNGPWTDPLKKNMQYVLGAMGALEPSLLEVAADSLYEKYKYEDESRKIQLLAVGSRKNQEYQKERPNLDQLLFADMLQFIYKRFHQFRMQKRDHKQWDSVGQYLYSVIERGEADFATSVLQEAGLASAQ